MIRRLLLCWVAGSLLVACGGEPTEGPSAGCDQPAAQPIDPGSAQHILPGAAEPSFNTDPPTSGPHAPGAHPTGVLSSPMPKAVQVTLLEGGEVLVQYRDLPNSQRRALERLASSHDHVTVAPNDALPSPIVATAWTFMLRCGRADQTAIDKFIAEHAGKGPGH